MSAVVSLHNVFGITEQVNEYSYVDRGGLDSQLGYALNAERHIAIHGESKQGKSWLRARMLTKDSFVLVQCQTGMTIESLFTEVLAALGVRAELRRTRGNEFEGTLDFRGSGSVGLHLLAKLGLDVKAGTRGVRSNNTESQPVGQTPGNLWWVAHTILASQRRLVIEDCHYLADDCLQELAFVMRALGGYGLHIIIAGIWPQDHLLTYYNGDLVGRVDDIHLRWEDTELDAVLRAGSKALKIEMSTNLRRILVNDAAGNVGLLQQLAEAICREERIYSAQDTPQYLTAGPSLERARSAVAESMRGRFEAFAENFDGALRAYLSGAPESFPTFKALIECSDEELLRGIDSDQLTARVESVVSISQMPAITSDLFANLTIAQATMNIRPPVFSYNERSRKVYVADRSLLFFRRYGTPAWS